MTHKALRTLAHTSADGMERYIEAGEMVDLSHLAPASVAKLEQIGAVEPVAEPREKGRKAIRNEEEQG